MQTLNWKKSAHSGDGSNCVEIAVTPATIHIRDSKKTGGPRVTVTPLAWTPFISFAAAHLENDFTQN
jgi:hypothetical protein